MLNKDRIAGVMRLRLGCSLAVLGTALFLPHAAQAKDNLETDTVVEAEQAAPAGQSSGVNSSASDDSSDAATADNQIVVTGTSIRGAAPVGSNLTSVTRDQITTIGAQTTEDIIRNTPSFGSFGQTRVPSGDFGQIGIKPSIHNIGAGATLTLMNGHRLVGAGILQTNADPSIIPPSAIERIEVIADGASSIYGSDAVAGVVNVILRRNFEGMELSARYGFANDYHTYNFNGVFGRKWDTGSIMIAGEYTGNDQLFGRDRSFVRQDQRSLGFNDLRSNAAIPPNIAMQGTTYSYPNFTTTPNLYDTSQVGSLIPASKRGSVAMFVRQQLSDNIELFGDALYSRRTALTFVDPGGQTPTITTANPFFVRVPGTTANTQVARLNVLPITGPLDTRVKLEGFNAVIGANITLGQFRLTLEGNYGHEDDTNKQKVINATAFAAAAAGTTLATALDPYTGRTAANIVAGFVGLNDARNVQELREGTARIDGPLFALPAGEVKLAAGIQYHYESLNQSYNTIGVNGTLVSKLDRDFFSQYAELLVPVFGGDFTLPLFQRLDFSASIRHDRYNDVGDTTNPKFGVNWSPVQGMGLHASYGTSFRAPPLADKNPASIDTRVQPIFAGTQFAPPGAPPSTYFYLAGSDPNLTPENATTYSFGGDYSPEFIPGLTVGATFWRVDYSNIIAIAFPPALYTDASLRQYFVNNPTNAQIASFIGDLRVDGLSATDSASKVAFLSGATRMIDLRRKNLGILKAGGIDFTFNYRTDVGPGALIFNVTGTKTNRWRTQASPTAAVVDNFVSGTQIKWRYRATTTYASTDFNATVAYNYVGGYTNLGVAAQPRVKPFDTVDLAASYNFGGTGLTKGLQLTLNIENLIDKDPPVRLTGNGYSVISNPLGRTITFGIRKTY